MDGASRVGDEGAAGPKDRKNTAALIMAVVAALVLAVSVSAIWLNRMVTDTEFYVRTVAPLAQDPDIQDAIADSASQALIEKVDARGRLESILPGSLESIAAPIGSAVDDFIRKQSVSLVRSDRFASLWEDMNRKSHAGLVAAITGRQGDVVDLTAGTLSLDVGGLADALKMRVADAGFGLAADVPTGSIDKRIVIYESPTLARTSRVVDVVSRTAYAMPFVGLVLALIAIVIAPDRRKAVLWLGGALALLTILPIQAVYLGQYYATAQLVRLASIPAPAAQAAFAIVFRDLISANRAAVALGAVLWLGALVLGPAKWAIAVRTGLSGGLGGIASRLDLGAFGAWVASRKPGLRAAGGAAAALLLLALPAPRTAAEIMWIAAGYLVWVLLVELLGAQPVRGSDGPVRAKEASP